MKAQKMVPAVTLRRTRLRIAATVHGTVVVDEPGRVVVEDAHGHQGIGDTEATALLSLARHYATQVQPFATATA